MVDIELVAIVMKREKVKEAQVLVGSMLYYTQVGLVAEILEHL